MVDVGDLSLFFHVLSLVSFIALGAALLRVQSQLKLWRDWNSGVAGSKVTVGEPLRLLRRFSGAIGADFETSATDSALPIRKVRLEGCFKLHQTAGISKIRVTKAEKYRVDFVLVREPSIMPIDLNQLSHELGGGIEVAILAGHHP